MISRWKQGLEEARAWTGISTRLEEATQGAKLSHPITKTRQLYWHSMPDQPTPAPMWGIIEASMGVEIPYKLLLDMNGFDNFISLKEFNSEDLDGVVKFGNDGSIKKIVKEDDLCLYVPRGDHESFMFVPGTRKLIYKVLEFAKKNHQTVDKSLATKRVLSSLRNSGPSVVKKSKSIDDNDVSGQNKSMAVVPSCDFF
ncbi:hypothetical protein ONE63_000078 [Megalurothrips usitatus]|uniref:Uncharacterized protein n=1 Tax=Megalurothrips usitatus TaxID=439358 RepID=A0AAV7Y467_9NEOP|nr:hypothetical protein ONE63_000078 [Megalurothrips usitatus]